MDGKVVRDEIIKDPIKAGTPRPDEFLSIGDGKKAREKSK
jgi:hypothetical protein